MKGNLFLSKKGISPILAVLLLLMLAVASAGAAFIWFSKMSSGLQAAGTEQVDAQTAKYGKAITIENVVYDNDSGGMEFTVVNNGRTTLREIRDICAEGISTTRTNILDEDLDPICSAVKWCGDGSNSYIECNEGCSEDLPGHDSRRIKLNLTNTTCYEGLNNNINKRITVETTFEPDGVEATAMFIAYAT